MPVEGTSNVLAGKIYDIPVSGTMAHSYISAFDSELEAFAAYADTFPDHSIFLIDTYDTLEGAKNAAVIAKEMQQGGHALIGVRLDSGEMAGLSQKVRKILDDAGLYDVKIFASSGFDEFKIAKVVSRGARIDAFGVGTKVGVSADAPYVDIVYKMVRFNERDIRKLSPGKSTLAGEKQVFRRSDQEGRYTEDIIGLRNESIEDKALKTAGLCWNWLWPTARYCGRLPLCMQFRLNSKRVLPCWMTAINRLKIITLTRLNSAAASKSSKKTSNFSLVEHRCHGFDGFSRILYYFICICVDPF